MIRTYGKRAWHFSRYFENFPDNYIVIGGTACDIIISGAGLTPRARLGAILTANDKFELPESIQADMQAFFNFIKNELPDKAIFKEMALGSINPLVVLAQLSKNFNLKAD